jgi:hypothetical protein
MCCYGIPSICFATVLLKYMLCSSISMLLGKREGFAIVIQWFYVKASGLLLYLNGVIKSIGFAFVFQWS